MSISSFALPSRSDSLPSGHLPAEFDYSRRRGQLVARLDGVEGTPQVALVCDPADITYLTGVREGISWLAVWEGGGFAVTRHMLIREVTGHVGELELLLPCERSTDRVELESFVVTELARRGFTGLAVNLERIGAASYLRLKQCAADRGLEVSQVECLVDSLRQCKDPLEREVISRCVAIAEKAFVGLLEEGANGLIGRPEIELARELESRMIALGADRQGFPDTGIIVASGPNSASAHHCPGGRRVMPGEPLLIDWGAEVDGYRSDMTRTLFIGSLPGFARKAYPVVEAALVAAADRLRAGVDMGEIDRLARDTVSDAGFTEFHYGVGHGIGLAIHEAPWLRAHSKDLLEEGMITTVEPGIYIPGEGGIRIERIFAISDSGAEGLDQLPTAMEQMVIE